ncbi:hypothetical protein [Pedobacter sp. SYSU D00535]|uniref:hypothetical protein n=1 Tax=Pedobacter sp. SYSU D00535 TaxID=2810308 RepID=UPI001A95BBE5|nr:hypothetical protein [Pedobacter sp. SYSU D00535]
MKKLLLLFLPLVISLASCREDTPELPEEMTVEAGIFQSTTEGSYWTYAATDMLGQYAEFTHTLTGKKEMKGGKEFYEASVMYDGQPSDEKAYYHCSSAGLYSIISSNINQDEETPCDYLDTKKAINTSWTTNYELGAGLPEARTQVTSKAKNFAMQVAGKQYKDVIQTSVAYQLKSNGAFVTVVTADYYIAKNVGIIKVVASNGPSVIGSVELIDYLIK